MKVLDLQCAHGHSFEGWFASEDDFVAQCQNALVQCPLCGDASVVKKLSAPRLHLAGRREAAPGSHEEALPVTVASDFDVAAAWLAVARQVLASTTDVGNRFAEEARKMHYGETEERSIRGKATPQEARSLVEEGIDVLPFVLPDALKETLQ
jgi:hypothetical protein